MGEYEDIVKSAMRRDEDFLFGLEIARKNSLGGSVWITGSFLYKNILNEKFGLSLEAKDYDFMLERQRGVEDAWCPEGWNMSLNFFGNPRFIGGRKSVDVYPLSSAENYDLCPRDFSKMSIKDKLDFYVSSQLFDLHCMAYDVDADRLISRGGVEAVEAGEVRARRLADCLAIARRKKMGIEEYMDYKFEGFGLRVVYPF